MSDQGKERDSLTSLGSSHFSKEHQFETEDFDSGIISGPLSDPLSGPLSGPLSSPLSKSSSEPKKSLSISHIDTNIDSGVIDDFKSPTKLHMLLDKEQITSDIKLTAPRLETSKSLNNLEKVTEHKIKSTPTITTPTTPQEDVSKLCYRQNDDGDTQLHIAIIHEIQRIIPTLIQLAPTPAWLDIQNDDAQTPLHLAVLTKQSLIVRRLLIFGANTSIRDADGNTPLHLACLIGDLNSIKEMLRPITAAEFRSYTSMKPSPNQSFPCRIPINLEQRNYQGEYCIHIAAERDRMDILGLLLYAGADPNAREGLAGYTPLHIAIQNNRKQMVEFILKYSKSVNIDEWNYGEFTPYQLAMRLKFIQIANLLESHGCDPFYEEEEEDNESEYDEDNASDDDGFDVNSIDVNIIPNVLCESRN